MLRGGKVGPDLYPTHSSSPSMFDVGFSEIVVIGVVALVVIGPERLPKVARTAGLLLGRLQRYVNDVKADINREMQLDELKKMQEQMTEQVRSMESSVTSEMSAVEESLNQSIAPPAVEHSPTTEPAAEALVAGEPPVAADLPVAENLPAEPPLEQLELGLDHDLHKPKV